MSTLKILALGAALAVSAPSLADTFWVFGFSPTDAQQLVGDAGTSQAFTTGWFNSSGVHQAGNTNYFVGAFETNELRNFFSFAVDGVYSSAELQIGNNADIGVNLGAQSSLTWTLYDLATTIDTSQDYSDIGIFNDLGTGVVYGAVTVTGPTALVTVSLNAAGLAALNAAAAGDGVFNVGGSLSGGGVVPEPATWAMLITGFGLVGFAARRRRAIAA